MRAIETVSCEQRVRMALAEAGYPDLGPRDVGSNGSVDPHVPIGVTWRAWQVCRVVSDCLACCTADYSGRRRGCSGQADHFACTATGEGVEDCGVER